jgi:hypothetical protein
MEYLKEMDSVITINKYPEINDERFFKNQAHMDEFESTVKKFAYPYLDTIKEYQKGLILFYFIY